MGEISVLVDFQVKASAVSSAVCVVGMVIFASEVEKRNAVCEVLKAKAACVRVISIHRSL